MAEVVDMKKLVTQVKERVDPPRVTKLKRRDRKRELTAQQRSWVKDFLKTGNKSEAARRNYKTKYPQKKGYALSHIPKIRTHIAELMDKMGISDAKLMEVLDEGLASWKPHTSPTEPDRDIPDFSVRHKYLKTALEMKGHLSDTVIEKHQTKVQQLIINNVEPEEFKALLKGGR